MSYFTWLGDCKLGKFGYIAQFKMKTLKIIFWGAYLIAVGFAAYWLLTCL